MGSKPQSESRNPRPATRDLPDVRAGDLVFTRIDNFLYRRVAAASGCWFNHVGVVVDATPGAERVAESTVPWVKITPLPQFIAKSAGGSYAVRRLPRDLSEEDQAQIWVAAWRRLGRLYHLGFDLDSRRQFCSKFVHEVYLEALDIRLGRTETFQELISARPETSTRFWRLWFFGFIPWERRTITPASEYADPQLVTVHLHAPAAGLTLP